MNENLETLTYKLAIDTKVTLSFNRSDLYQIKYNR